VLLIDPEGDRARFAAAAAADLLEPIASAVS
jgi:hypothetical protein